MIPRFHILLITALLSLRASAALTDGLAAYYDFESDLQDKSGNSRHLAVTGGNPEAGWAGGAVTRNGSSVDRNTLLAGNALNLVDEDTDALKAPLGSGPSSTAGGYFNLGGNFTISAWHYLAPLPSNTSPRYFVFEGESNYDISWGTVSGDSYRVYNAEIGGPTVDLSRNAWHHVVHVFRTVDDLILVTAYVDGIEIGEFSAAASTMDFSRLVLGNARSGQDRRWDGLLDEVAIWNRALTPAELGELHARGLAGIGVTESLASRGKGYLYLTPADPFQGTVSGTGLHDLGEVVPVVSQASAGYAFVSWDGGFTGQPASFNHTVTGSVTATASFAKDLGDSDGDGLSNYDEIAVHGTNPNLADSDGDGLPDADEILVTGTNPIHSDVALLERASEIFGPGHSGAVALRDVHLDAAGSTTNIVLSAGLTGSSDRILWQAVPLTGGDVSIDGSGRLLLRFPAPSSSVLTYQVLGYKP